MAFTTSEYISAGSLLVSCGAAFVATWSLRNSSAALAISKSDHLQKKRSLGVYLVQAGKVKRNQDEVFAAFALSYTNAASIANTMVTLELIVYYTDESGVVRETFLSAHDKAVLPKENLGIKIIQLPLNISARSSVTGWIVFKFPDHLRSKKIKKYEVLGQTSDSQRVSVECYLLMDMHIYAENK